MASDYKMLRQGINSIGDYQRLQEEFELKKQLAAQAATGQAPAAVKLANEIQAARASGDTQRLNDLQMSAKLLDRGIVYDQMGNPVAMGGYGDALGSIAGTKQMYEQNAQNQSDLLYKPYIARDIAMQQAGVEGATKPQIEADIKEAELNVVRQDARRGEFDTNAKTLPIIDELLVLNQDSPTIPYAGKTQWVRRLVPGTSDAERSVDLMKQARLDLAAPLAKQLGVNPTDKDFQASLDRIFDIEASKESREAQIEALGNRIQQRQQQLSPQGAVNLGGQNFQRLSVDDLNTVPSAGNTMGLEPSLMDRAETEFNNKKTKRLKYNPATGEFE